jgi:hypothetical protein
MIIRGIILILYFQTKLNSEVECLNKSPTLQLSPKTTTLKVWMRISLSLLLATPAARTQILFPLVLKI